MASLMKIIVMMAFGEHSQCAISKGAPNETHDYCSSIPPAPIVICHLCEFNRLSLSPNQSEYFPGDKVNVICLQSCNARDTFFCQPSLFYGSREVLFPQQGTELFVDNCRYYRYVLVDMDTKELAGHNLTCGGQVPGTNPPSDLPLTITVKPSEFLIHDN